MKIENLLSDHIDEIGDQHLSTSRETPLRPDAFDLSNSDKILLIEEKMREILHVLGMDLTDDSLSGTPRRVAKMFINEIFSGLHPNNKPKASSFKNKYQYGEMLVEKNITVFSTCEHHLLPIYGKAHVAYFAKDRVVGLSKMNRIVDYYSRRPQVQERLNIQIVKALQKILKTDDVACIIDAKHMCVNSRGIRHIDCSTVTGEFGGKFKDKLTKREFLDYIRK